MSELISLKDFKLARCDPDCVTLYKVFRNLTANIFIMLTDTKAYNWRNVRQENASKIVEIILMLHLISQTRARQNILAA